jgi:small multidrug resistance pump
MWWWLAVAIASEVCATVSLRYSEGFSRLGPVVVVLVGYTFSFYALSHALQRGMTIATAYAIWSAIGISAIAILGIVLFDESLSVVQLLGLVLVTLGVVALQSGA